MTKAVVPGMLAIKHAVENASNQPITEAEIIAVLQGAGGNPSHVRAIFGDVSLQAIASVGASAGTDLATILDAYRAAREAVAAANPELDAALAERW